MWIMKHIFNKFCRKKFELNFNFKGAKPEKDPKLWPFKEFQHQKSDFFDIFQKFFRNGFHAPFIPYIDTQTLYMWEKNFIGIPQICKD